MQLWKIGKGFSVPTGPVLETTENIYNRRWSPSLSIQSRPFNVKMNNWHIQKTETGIKYMKYSTACETNFTELKLCMHLGFYRY